MNAVFADAGAVAAMLGLPDRGSFLRRRAALEAEHGFPVPMPHSHRPLLWRRAQVDAWIAEHGTPTHRAPGVGANPSNVVLLHEASRP